MEERFYNVYGKTIEELYGAAYKHWHPDYGEGSNIAYEASKDFRWGIDGFIRTELSRERQSVIQILEGMIEKGFGSCMECTEGTQALEEAISLLSKRKGQ